MILSYGIVEFESRAVKGKKKKSESRFLSLYHHLATLNGYGRRLELIDMLKDLK